jgi:two-component system cell cycle sensor histidine kinase/response regulator CckA
LVKEVEERRTGRILIVDDETALLVVMEQYLRRLGYDVAACRSGQQAWSLFEPQPLAYSMVLADITMPEMSGKELLLRMLQLNPAICILICSGYPFDVSTLPATLHQQIGFLQKPFTPRMLAGSIEQLLAARRGAAQE